MSIIHEHQPPVLQNSTITGQKNKVRKKNVFNFILHLAYNLICDHVIKHPHTNIYLFTF